MKRFLTLGVFLCFLLSLWGCTTAVPPSANSSVPSTATTVPTVTETQIQPTKTQSTQTQSTVTQPTQPTATQPTQPENPVDPDTLWVPICQEYINLRATPEGELLTTVEVGETFVLNGFQGKYALVTYGDIQGYVLSSYIKPADKDYLSQQLKVVVPTAVYSYQQMLEDISALQVLYPDSVRTASIGMSELGRRIPVIQIGNPEAKYHVLMQGAIHAREHFTACLLMAMADYALSQGQLNDVCYHIIPMSNPDGVILSQTGVMDSTQKAIYNHDLANGYASFDTAEYARQWKANALGVDLNRNFPSGWELCGDRLEPSAQRYRGSEAFCAAETQALRDYTLQRKFDATISFHSHGSVIYYKYGNRQPVNQLSYSLALAAQAATGYTPMSYDGTTGAGYKDWVMDALGIPSLTIEIGCYDTPMPQQEIYSTFARCQTLLPAINTWLQEQT